MAALAKAAVSPYGGFANISAAEFYQRNSQLVVRRLKLVLTGQGGQTNTIGAHALGFELLVDCSTLFDATNSKGYPAAIDPVNNILVLFDGAAAPAPVDVTSTATYITVYGVPRLTPTLT
jgi:hypothetical protein